MTIAPRSPWRWPVSAEMPPILETPGTPEITSTSPSSARLCASNSAMPFLFSRAATNGSARRAMLRTVSAGPQISLPGIVGRSVDAPIAPSGTPRSSITSEIRLVHSPSARKRSTAPAGGFGVEVMRMRSAAMRPVSFFAVQFGHARRLSLSAVMAAPSRSKNGVASLAYVAAISLRWAQFVPQRGCAGQARA